VAELGRWVANLGRRRWVAKLVAHLLAKGSNPDISQKFKMGDISKGVANTLQLAKKYTKKNNMIKKEMTVLFQLFKKKKKR
jgi:hypothetical protein